MKNQDRGPQPISSEMVYSDASTGSEDQYSERGERESREKERQTEGRRAGGKKERGNERRRERERE